MVEDSKKDEILSVAINEEVIGDFETLTKSGKDFVCKCPNCNKEGKGKGLKISPAKKLYKCYSCDWGGNNPAKYLMLAQNMNFPEALRYMADKYNITIKTIPKIPSKKSKDKIISYRDIQLTASGISDESQKAEVYIDEDTVKIVDIFESGTRDEYYHLTEGDDMIIWYYDLNGKQIMYPKPKTQKMEPLYRIRWQYPDLHLDQHGKPKKYESPYGSGSHLFIPDIIRKMYKEGRQIKRLFLQEGEKKAWKACQHGILSVGIMGIQNIASNKKLPYDLQLLIKVCRVEEIIFLLDSDWSDLNKELYPGMRVDQRPRSFFYAVKNFKEYFKTFANSGIYLELYFAHLIKPEEKGIDDLLAGSLKGHENKLLEDINVSINEKEGLGEYIQLHKISVMPDLKLLEIWSLHSASEFAQKYKEQLKELAEFYIGKIKWRFDDTGKLVPTQPLQPHEMYWEKCIREDKFGNDISTYKFSYTYAYNFLNARGFGRYRLNNTSFIFVRVIDNIIETWEAWQIRDFVVEFTKEVCPKEDMKEVMDMLYRGAKMYLGPDSLGNLPFMELNFEPTNKHFKVIYFSKKHWIIDAEGVKEMPNTALVGNVWSEKLIDFDASYLGNNFIQLTQFSEEFLNKNKDRIEASGYEIDDFANITNWFFMSLSEDAKKCHFLKFLLNTSDFYWQKELDNHHQPLEKPVKRTVYEEYEQLQHFISKLTAMAFLIHKFRNKSCERAVIGMDGKNSEIGDSNGRSGKSLLGMALNEVVPSAYISGKNKTLTDDIFLFEEVTEKHDVIFIDDVRSNVDFEFFFPIITGRLTVNGKGTKKFTLSEQQTPQLYFTTNHSINGFSASFRDRQFLLAFSDYYSDNWKPINDFHVNFFSEWDSIQKNLFFNLMAHAFIIYFKIQKEKLGLPGSGLLPAPVARLERRQLRQFIGEAFLSWADSYFGVIDNEDSCEVVSTRLDEEINKKEIFDDFILSLGPADKKFHTPFTFKKRFRSWCAYRNLIFNKNARDKEGNPHAGDIKKNGIEYFKISKYLYEDIQNL
ncbi:MAG: CHC2 zinc finger domain-containing protein [Bacteroidales bacterium]